MAVYDVPPQAEC